MIQPPPVASRWRRVLQRERRLLGLCALSVLTHALVLGLLARVRPDLRSPAATPQLRVVLSHGAPAGASAAPRSGSSVSAPALPLPLPPARTRQAPRATAAATGGTIAEPLPAAPGVAAASVAAPGWVPDPGGLDASGPHRPGYQATRTPPSAHLAYAVTRSGSAQPASAELDWNADAQGYRLALRGDGVLGEVASQGQMADAGFVPVQARAGDSTVVFDWTASRATLSRDLAVTSASALVSADAQDTGSMLMRLAAIGLADPSQLSGGVELQVVGAGGIANVQFDALDEDPVATPLGLLAALHLRQRVAAGQPCLEIWLAPARSWYPVQLRLTAADGASVTQTVSAIEAK